jgi:hypothetical protein
MAKVETQKEFTFNETLGFFTDADGKVHPDSVKELNRRWLTQERKRVLKEEEFVYMPDMWGGGRISYRANPEQTERIKLIDKLLGDLK